MSDAPRVLIAFYSRNGCTAALAEGIAAGVREAGGEPILKRVDEFVDDALIERVPGWKASREALRAKYSPPTPEDAAGADAIIFGTPTRFGSVSSELKSYIDSLGGLWAQGKLVGKVGSAFCTTSTTHGGNEVTSFTMFAPMAHLGLIIVPTGYVDPVTFAAGTPYGASAVSGQDNAPPTEADLAVARVQGKRVTEVARALKAAKG